MARSPSAAAKKDRHSDRGAKRACQSPDPPTDPGADDGHGKHVCPERRQTAMGEEQRLEQEDNGSDQRHDRRAEDDSAEARSCGMGTGACNARHFQRRQNESESARCGERHPRFRTISDNALQANRASNDEWRRCREPPAACAAGRYPSMICIKPPRSNERRIPFSQGTPLGTALRSQRRWQVSWLAGFRVPAGLPSFRSSLVDGSCSQWQSLRRTLAAHSCGGSPGLRLFGVSPGSLFTLDLNKRPENHRKKN